MIHNHEPFDPSQVDAQEARELSSEARKQLCLDYAGCFAGTRGEKVLAHLKKMFGFSRPSAIAGGRSEDVWLREGMKQPIYHIDRMLALARIGGEKPKPERSGRGVKRGRAVMTPETPPEKL